MNLLDQCTRQASNNVCANDTEEEFRTLSIGELEKRREKYEGLVQKHPPVGTYNPGRFQLQIARIQAEIARRPPEDVFRERVTIQRSSSS